MTELEKGKKATEGEKKITDWMGTFHSRRFVKIMLRKCHHKIMAMPMGREGEIPLEIEIFMEEWLECRLIGAVQIRVQIIIRVKIRNVLWVSKAE